MSPIHTNKFIRKVTEKAYCEKDLHIVLNFLASKKKNQQSIALSLCSTVPHTHTIQPYIQMYGMFSHTFISQMAWLFLVACTDLNSKLFPHLLNHNSQTNPVYIQRWLFYLNKTSFRHSFCFQFPYIKVWQTWLPFLHEWFYVYVHNWKNCVSDPTFTVKLKFKHVSFRRTKKLSVQVRGCLGFFWGSYVGNVSFRSVSIRTATSKT